MGKTDGAVLATLLDRYGRTYARETRPGALVRVSYDKKSVNDVKSAAAR